MLRKERKQKSNTIVKFNKQTW